MGLGQSLYHHRVAALAGGFVLLADQLTKDLANTLWDHSGPGFGVFSFKVSTNPGVALGVMGGLPEGLRVPVILLLSLLAAVGIALISRPFAKGHAGRGWGLALLFAGAVGNSIDRLWHGYVIDFIELDLGEAALPSFNVADLAVGIGAFLVATVVARGALQQRTVSLPGGDEMDFEQNELLALPTETAPENAPSKKAGVLLKMSPGTTLVEILIVIAIIGLVLGAVAIGVLPLFSKGQKGIAHNGTKIIEEAYGLWRAQHPDQECPESLDDLKKVIKKGQEINDPWGSAYQIECPSTHDRDIDVISAGPDKKHGTDDDIANWMPTPKE